MQFLLAEEEDKEEIMSLYRKAVGSEGCTWSQDYPNEKILEEDFLRKDLFVLKTNQKEIVGAISIDDDILIEELPCWSQEQKPGAELARLVVKETYQNQGLARKMLQEAMKVLRERKYRSVHFLVSKTNERAIRSYAKLAFENKGEADLYEEHWWCYEKVLHEGGEK